MDYVIYGAGYRGKRFYEYIGGKNVRAFIDMDVAKQGGICHGLPIISLDEYLRKYESCFIVITPTYSNNIEEILETYNIYQYSNLRDMPSEFAGYGECGFEDCYSGLKEQYSEKLCVYGSNAFSIMIYDFLNQNENISICLENGCKPQKIAWLKKHFSEIKIKEITDIQDDEIVLVSVAGEYKNRFFNKTLNLFEYANDNALYRNEKLLKVKDIFKNDKRCFIVATGPSLRMEDLHTLAANHLFCFGVNSIIQIQEKWTADAYVAADSKFIADNIQSIRNYNCEFRFVGDSCNEYWKKELSDSYKMHVTTSGKSIDFSEEVEQKIYGGYRDGGTVTYVCLQLAVYMGFSEIYLLGVDCNYVKGSKNNHFISDAEKDDRDHKVDVMVKAYEYAKKYADSHDIKIYNATRGGMLEVFERVDFDSLFDGGEDS